MIQKLKKWLKFSRFRIMETNGGDFIVQERMLHINGSYWASIARHDAEKKAREYIEKIEHEEWLKEYKRRVD